MTDVVCRALGGTAARPAVAALVAATESRSVTPGLAAAVFGDDDAAWRQLALAGLAR